MKHLLLGFISLLLCINCMAEVVSIKLIKVRLPADTRSMFITPIVTCEGNIINIYSDAPISNLEVKVTNSTGQIVYYDIVTVDSEKSFSHTMHLLQNEEYKIELATENESYYGTFYIE